MYSTNKGTSARDAETRRRGMPYVGTAASRLAPTPRGGDEHEGPRSDSGPRAVRFSMHRLLRTMPAETVPQRGQDLAGIARAASRCFPERERPTDDGDGHAEFFCRPQGPLPFAGVRHGTGNGFEFRAEFPVRFRKP